MSKGLIDSTTIMFLAGIVLIAVLASYSSSKGAESFQQDAQHHQAAQHQAAQHQAAKHKAAKKPSLVPTIAQVRQGADAGVSGADTSSSQFSSVSGMDTQMPQVPGCSGTVTDPKDLLPPAGSNAFGQPAPPPKEANFLQAGYHMGIDTIGQSLRNANLQLRSEPPNPQQKVGPWNESTIDPDLMRVPLEIGCGSQ